MMPEHHDTAENAAHAHAHRKVRAALATHGHRAKAYALAAVAGTHHHEAESWIHGAAVTGALTPELSARLADAAALLGVEPSAEHVERAAWAVERREKITALAARVRVSFNEAERFCQGNARLDGVARERFDRAARELGIQPGAEKWGTRPVGEQLPGVNPLPPMTGPDVEVLRGTMRR